MKTINKRKYMKQIMRTIVMVIAIIIPLLTLSILVPTAKAITSSQGINSPQVVTGWTNPDNSKISDNVYTTGPSVGLTAKGYGFDIPLEATIVGLEINVERKMTRSGTAYIADSMACLVINGTPDYNANRAVIWTQWSLTTEENKIFGSPTDTWGLSLTPEIVNNPNFGFLLQPNKQGSIATAFVDFIGAKVYFTLPDTTTPTITIDPYITTPTNQDIVVTASTDVGTLNETSHTFSTNGSFDFIATNGAQVTTQTVTITNIDKAAPTGTITYDQETLTNGSVNATLNPSEDIIIDSVGGLTHLFENNGTFIFSYHDPAGNVGSTTAAVDWIDKTNPMTSFDISGGQVGNDGWFKGTVAPTITLSTETDALIYWRWNSAAWSSGITDQHPIVTNGVRTLEFYSVDLATNEETPHQTRNIKYDNVAPVINIIGTNPVAIAAGDSYTDAGATANDDLFGNISGSIISTNNVNTAQVGNYTVSYNVSDPAGNEAITVTRDVNVVPRSITVTADDQTKVFGVSDPSLTYQITSGSLVGTDIFAGSLSRDAGEDVGTYTINQGTLTLSNNYNLTFIGADLNIVSFSITVTIDSKSKIYSTADPALTYQITSGSLVGTDTLTGSLTRVAGENVGTYAISGNLTNPNYFVTINPGEMQITPASVTVVCTPKTKTFGSADPPLTFAIASGSQFVNMSNFTGALSRAAGEDSGVYEIQQGTLTLGNNFNLSFIGSNLEITPAPPVVTPTNPVPVTPVTTGFTPTTSGTDITLATVTTPVETLPLTTFEPNSGNSSTISPLFDITASPVQSNSGVVMGLMWYWWLLIFLAVIALMIWWIIAAKRRKKREQ